MTLDLDRIEALADAALADGYAFDPMGCDCDTCAFKEALSPDVAKELVRDLRAAREALVAANAALVALDLVLTNLRGGRGGVQHAHADAIRAAREALGAVK